MCGLAVLEDSRVGQLRTLVQWASKYLSLLSFLNLGCSPCLEMGNATSTSGFTKQKRRNRVPSSELHDHRSKPPSASNLFSAWKSPRR